MKGSKNRSEKGLSFENVVVILAIFVASFVCTSILFFIASEAFARNEKSFLIPFIIVFLFIYITLFAVFRYLEKQIEPWEHKTIRGRKKRHRSVQAEGMTDWDGSQKLPTFPKLVDNNSIIEKSPPIREEAAKTDELQEEDTFSTEAEKKEGESEIYELQEFIRAEEEDVEAEREEVVELEYGADVSQRSIVKRIPKWVYVILVGGVVLTLLLVEQWHSANRQAEKPQLAKPSQELIKKEPGNQESFTNGIGMKFVLIPAGTFMMGSSLSHEEVAQEYGGTAKYYEDEHPQHKVMISKPFYLQTTEVTQRQWKRVMGNNPSNFKDCGDDCPVEQVSWNDVQDFIRRLNDMESTDNYRLPTEAEWEYACRAGSATRFYFGDDKSRLGEHGWYGSNAMHKTHPVAGKKPNAWGLYDMHGNVYEWVEDDWHINYEGAPDDERGWTNKPRGPRVVRGGGWPSFARGCRSASRNGASPGLHDYAMGFRLARSINLGS